MINYNAYNNFQKKIQTFDENCFVASTFKIALIFIDKWP